jgi:hypothetical protein
MAAPPARARADYDYLIKLLLIGDSGQWLSKDPHHSNLSISLERDLNAKFEFSSCSAGLHCMPVLGVGTGDPGGGRGSQPKARAVSMMTWQLRIR